MCGSATTAAYTRPFLTHPQMAAIEEEARNDSFAALGELPQGLDADNDELEA